MARAYPARVHLRCGAAHSLRCYHDKTRWLMGNRITELPAQTFDRNAKLTTLYVPVGLRRRPWWSMALPRPLLPFKRARLRSIAGGEVMRVHRGDPLRVCIPLVPLKTSC